MLDGWTGGYILAAIFDVVVIHAGLQIRPALVTVSIFAS